MLKNKRSFWAVGALATVCMILAACGETATPLATTSSAAGTTAGAAATTSGTTTAAGAATTTSGTAMASGTAMTTTSGAATTSGTAMASGTAMMTTSGTAMASGTPAMTGGAMTTSGTAMASGTPAMTGGTMTGGAMTASGTAMASGTPAMTGGAMAGNTANFPTISDATVVPADTVVAPALAQQLGTLGIKPTAVQFYVSDDDAATLANNADTAITGKGYKFNLPTFSKPLTLPGTSNTLGLYNQTGQPDLLLLIAAVPTDASKVGSTFLLPGIDTSTSQTIANNLKGHKSAMILVSGANLQQAVLNLVTTVGKSITPGTNGSAPTSGATATTK